MKKRNFKFLIFAIPLVLAGGGFFFFNSFQALESESFASLTCETALTKPDPRLVGPKSCQFFKATSKRTMAYDYKPAGAGGRTMLFIHGLGDDMFSLQKLVKLAEKEGFGILRVDLNGHGETLNAYLRENKNQLPAELDYQDNVQDLKKLIGFLKIKSLSIVGHSYGGGIALKLAEQLPKTKLLSVHVLAPYVQRIDKFISDNLQSPMLLISSAQQIAQAAGQKNTSNIFDPLSQMMWNMTKTFRYWRDLSSSMWGLNQMKDRLMDPALEKVMSESYRAYFLNYLKKTEKELSTEESQLLDLKVEAAVKATKGIRGMDYLDPTQGIGKFPAIFQIFGGQNDKLVLPQQLKEFTYRLDQYNVKYQYFELKGENATHFFPQNSPEDVYQKMLEELTRPGN